ncbi:MAG TPA: hypothetical protein VF963_06710 [Gaiellaceae bacterium]
MRARTFSVLVTSFLVLGAPSSAPGATRPALHLVRDLPLTVRGSAFRPGERVRVTVRMGEQRLVRQTHAGATGGFTVRFAGTTLDYCATPLTITARGARSGLVAAKIPVRECAAP